MHFLLCRCTGGNNTGKSPCNPGEYSSLGASSCMVNRRYFELLSYHFPSHIVCFRVVKLADIPAILLLVLVSHVILATSALPEVVFSSAALVVPILWAEQMSAHYARQDRVAQTHLPYQKIVKTENGVLLVWSYKIKLPSIFEAFKVKCWYNLYFKVKAPAHHVVRVMVALTKPKNLSVLLDFTVEMVIHNATIALLDNMLWLLVQKTVKCVLQVNTFSSVLVCISADLLWWAPIILPKIRISVFLIGFDVIIIRLVVWRGTTGFEYKSSIAHTSILVFQQYCMTHLIVHLDNSFQLWIALHWLLES